MYSCCKKKKTRFLISLGLRGIIKILRSILNDFILFNQMHHVTRLSKDIVLAIRLNTPTRASTTIRKYLMRFNFNHIIIYYVKYTQVNHSNKNPKYFFITRLNEFELQNLIRSFTQQNNNE